MPISQMEFTQYITPDGSVYDFDARQDRFLLSETGFGMPPITYITQRSPLQHGETVIDYRLGPRVIQLVHRRNACSRTQYYANRSALLDAIRPNRQGYYGRALPPLIQPGQLRKILPDGSKRDIDVVIEEGPVFAPRNLDVWDEWGFTETLRFIAHDPLFYNPTIQSQTYTLATTNELVLPFDFPVVFDLTDIVASATFVNAGSWETFPIITVTGPCSGFQISNISTGDDIFYFGMLSSTEIVTIDLRFGRKTVTSSIYGNMMSRIRADSDIATFRLVPSPEATSGNNIVKIVISGANSSTAVNIRWYNRYIGI